METALFNSMIQKIQDLINNSKKCADVVAKADDAINNMSVKDYNQICKLARQVQADEDRIFNKKELIHVIGMGKLDKEQKVILFDNIEELCQYRSAVKCLASYPTVKNIVPGEKSSYEVSCLLGGVVLEKNNNLCGQYKEDLCGIRTMVPAEMGEEQ